MEDIEMFESLEMMDSYPFKAFNVHITHAYRQSSRRGPTCIRDTLDIMNEQFQGVCPAMKIGRFGRMESRSHIEKRC